MVLKTKKPVEVDEETIYEVEKICGHRRSTLREDLVEYFIKWKDYEPKHNTWEKEYNIYSKGLINEYWKSQPYSLASFKKNTHTAEIKTPALPPTLPKKRPAPTSHHRVDRKQQIQQIRSSQISALPPTGYVWSDIEAIVNVFHNEPTIYFAEVKWPNSNQNTYIPTRIIKKYNPLKLIYFYESRLEFYLPAARS